MMLRWVTDTTCRRAALVLGMTASLATQVNAQATPGRFAVELESGATWQSYNDVQIPNDASGTRLSLQQLAGSGPGCTLRWCRSGARGEGYLAFSTMGPTPLSGNGIGLRSRAASIRATTAGLLRSAALPTGIHRTSLAVPCSNFSGSGMPFP